MSKYNNSRTLLKYAFNQYQVSKIGGRKFSSIYNILNNINISKIGTSKYNYIRLNVHMDTIYKISSVGDIL